jgi:hypothetical protein
MRPKLRRLNESKRINSDKLDESVPPIILKHLSGTKPNATLRTKPNLSALRMK